MSKSTNNNILLVIIFRLLKSSKLACFLSHDEIKKACKTSFSVEDAAFKLIQTLYNKKNTIKVANVEYIFIHNILDFNNKAKHSEKQRSLHIIQKYMSENQLIEKFNCNCKKYSFEELIKIHGHNFNNSQLYNFLYSAFIWHETPEGFFYWKRHADVIFNLLTKFNNE